MLKVLNNIMELVIWLGTVWKLVGNELDCFGKFVGNLCNTSLNKVLKKGLIDTSFFCPQDSWLTHLRSFPQPQPMQPDD